MGDQHAARTRRARLTHQAQQRMGQALADPLGGQLAHAGEGIGHMRRDLAGDVQPHLREAIQQRPQDVARPGQQARRFHGQCRHRVHGRLQDGHTAKRLARSDEADDELLALRRELQELQEA